MIFYFQPSLLRTTSNKQLRTSSLSSLSHPKQLCLVCKLATRSEPPCSNLLNNFNALNPFLLLQDPTQVHWILWYLQGCQKSKSTHLPPPNLQGWGTTQNSLPQSRVNSPLPLSVVFTIYKCTTANQNQSDFTKRQHTSIHCVPNASLPL